MSDTSLNSNLISNSNEAERIAALYRYEILDTAPEEAFDRLTSLVAQILNVPIALITLVDSDRVWVKSGFGTDITQTSRIPGFCSTALNYPSIYSVPDTLENADTKSHPMVTGEMGIRFYAAAPMRNSAGFALGVLCIMGRQPRQLSAQDENYLVHFAALAMNLIESRLNETRLRESEERYRSLVEFSPFGIYVQVGGKMVYVNPTAARLYGSENASELIGRKTGSFIHPDYRAALSEQINRDAEQMVFENIYETKILLKNGKTIDIELAGFTTSYQGKLARQGIIKDITERKQAEILLNGQKHILEMIATGQPLRPILEAITRFIEQQSVSVLCSILLLDTEGKHLRHGAAPSLPKEFSEAIDGIAIGPKVGSCGTAAFLGQPIIVTDIATDPLWDDYRILALSHNLRACWSIPIFSTSGQTLGTFAMYYREAKEPDLRDWQLLNAAVYLAGIAIERHQGAEMLFAEKERMDVTLQAVGDGIITMDANLKIILFNPAAAELTGWGQAEALGQEITALVKLLDPKTRHPIPDPPARVLETGRPDDSSTAVVLRSRQGNEHWISYNAAPIHDNAGQLSGVVLALRDVTERQRLADEMLKASKLESMSILAGGIAHDFNNILMAVLGNLGLAQTYAQNHPKLHRQLEEAEKAALQAKNLTRQLLTFSKGGAPIKQTARLTEILRDTTQFALTGSNVQAQFNLLPDLWPVEVDRGQLSQVVQNLVINAVQAMPNGGKIFVNAENFHLTGQELPLPAGRYLLISISDQGYGIEPAHLPRIFDPYFTTKEQGSGLGLAICFSIIRQHGGLITVNSEPGQGTTFQIYLPASSHALPAQISQKSDNMISGQGRVLVMDDEPSIRYVVRAVLLQLGYEVEVTADGAAAIEAYREAMNQGQPFDVVLMDLTVRGGMGGKEAVRVIRQLDPMAKVIASSGYSAELDLSRYQEYGFVNVVGKPYSIEELGQIVQTTLQTDYFQQ